jgi:superfamily I DNA and/or RNA helicase
VYLVGDPVQLPATVISSTALDLNYDCSMFKRLQAAGYPVRVLNEQYRMHPNISAFPSQEFYQGKLLDGKVRGRAGHHTWKEGLFGNEGVDLYEEAGRGGAGKLPGPASVCHG